jgi:hypothetical protein
MSEKKLPELETRKYVDAKTGDVYEAQVPQGAAPKPYEVREGESPEFVLWRAQHEETQLAMVQTAIVITNDERLLPARLSKYLEACDYVGRDDPNFARVDALRALAQAIETLQVKAARLSQVLKANPTTKTPE